MSDNDQDRALHSMDAPTGLDVARYTEVESALACLRPAMEADAGGVELVSVSEGVVSIRMKGTCLVCPSVGLTLRRGIEPALRSRLSWVREVRRVD